jgi:hypothetical protein
VGLLQLSSQSFPFRHFLSSHHTKSSI